MPGNHPLAGQPKQKHAPPLCKAFQGFTYATNHFTKNTSCGTVVQLATARGHELTLHLSRLLFLRLFYTIPAGCQYNSHNTLSEQLSLSGKQSKNTIMKFILVFIQLICFTSMFSQIKYGDIVIKQAQSKNMTEQYLRDHIIRESKMDIRNSLYGRLEMITADAQGEITTAFLTIDKQPYLALVFYNDYRNEYGNHVKRMGIDLIEADTAMELLNHVHKELDRLTGSNSAYDSDQDGYLIIEYGDYRFYNQDPVKNPYEVFVFSKKSDMVSRWSASNFQRTFKRFAENYQEFKTK